MIRSRSFLICTLFALLIAVLIGDAGYAQPESPAAKQVPGKPKTDALGDPLPAGAEARLGTTRFVVNLPITSVMGGKAFLFPDVSAGDRSFAALINAPNKAGASADSRYRLMDAESGKTLDSWRFTDNLEILGHSADARWALLGERINPGKSFFGKKDEPAKELKPFAFTLYDLKQKREVRKLEGKDDGAQERAFAFRTEQAIFSRDGKWIATRSRGRVRLWEAASGKQAWESPPLDKKDKERLRETLDLVGFTSENSLILAKENGSVTVVDPIRKAIVGTFPTMQWAVEDDDYGMPLTLAPDGSAVLVGEGKTGAIRIWDVKTGKERPALTGHKGRDPAGGGFSTFALEFSPDGRTLLTHHRNSLFGLGGIGAGVKEEKDFLLVRDWPTGKIRQKLDLGKVVRLFVSADGKSVSVANFAAARLQRFDLESGKPLPQPADGHHRGVTWIATVPDGTIVSADQESAMHTWDPRAARQIRLTRFDADADNSPLQSLLSRTSLALSPDGKRLAMPSLKTNENALVILDRESGESRLKIPLAAAKAKGFASLSSRLLAFSPDGRLLAFTEQASSGGGKGNSANLIRILDSHSGKEVAEVQFQSKTGGGFGGFGVSAFRLRTSTLAFNPDGRSLLTIAGDQVMAWDAKTWKEIAGLPIVATAFTISPDGSMVACADGNEITLWEFASRKVRARIKGNATSLNFAPDGRFLAYAVEGSFLHVWDVYRNQLAAEYRGHDGPINCLTFLADSKRVVTGSSDCTLLVWNLPDASIRAPQPKPLADKVAAWNDLGSADPEKAFAAARDLITDPGTGTALLRDRLQPTAKVDLTPIAKHVKALESDAFAVRQRAMKDLQAMGEQAEASLRDSLTSNLPLETRQRLQQVLAAILAAADTVTDPDRLRTLRAIEVLERIGTPEARIALQTLASGAPGARVTTTAQAALKR